MRLFCVANRRFSLKTFQTASRALLEFTKKFLPATQNSPFQNSLGFVIFSFLLTISRPPRGYVKTKKTPSHFIGVLPHSPVRRSPDPRTTMPGHHNPIP